MKELTLPFNSPEFIEAWELLLSEKKWRNKSKNALRLSLLKLSRVSESEAIEAIENAISGGYQGVFPKVNKKNIINSPIENIFAAYQKSLKL